MRILAFRQAYDMKKPQEIKNLVEQNTLVFVLTNSEVCNEYFRKNHGGQMILPDREIDGFAQLYLSEANTIPSTIACMPFQKT